MRQKLREHLPLRFSDVGKATGKQVVRNRCKAVLVGSRSDELSRQRFRCHVHERAYKESSTGKSFFRGLIGLCSDSKIEELRFTRDRVVHDVIGLQVPMNDTRSVHSIDRIGDLSDDVANFIGCERSVLLSVFFEKLAKCPLDGEIVYPRSASPTSIVRTTFGCVTRVP